MRVKTHATRGVLPVKSYVFAVELVEEDDGRFSAGVPTLPGCATWGNSREEALNNLSDAVELYIRDMKENGEEVPEAATIEQADTPVVAVSI